MVLRTAIFLIINFGALALGRWLMGEGPDSCWYNDLEKAPWTPPGWVFGAAWTTIMACFALYMAKALGTIANTKFLLTLFTVQWLLNVSWNPVFFNFHQALAGLVIITALTILVIFIFIRYLPDLKAWSVLLLPYVIWMLIATSLNGYIYFKN